MYASTQPSPGRRLSRDLSAQSPSRMMAVSSATQSLFSRAGSVRRKLSPINLTGQQSDHATSILHQHAAVVEEEAQLVEEYGDRHWRVRIFRLLHRHSVILFLAGLLFLDILLLVIDLVLEGAFPECSVIASRTGCIVVGPGADRVSCDQVCHPPRESVETTKYVLTVASIGILSLFLIELVLHWLTVGARRFCTNPFLLFDLCIVLTSLWLEVVMTMHEARREGDDVQAVTLPLLVISRSWRLLRLGHGALKEAHDYYGQKISSLENEIAELQGRLTAAQKELGSTFSIGV